MADRSDVENFGPWGRSELFDLISKPEFYGFLGGEDQVLFG